MSDDWPRQQWARLTRQLLELKAPTRRGGMRRDKHRSRNKLLRTILATYGIPEVSPMEHFESVATADFFTSFSFERIDGVSPFNDAGLRSFW